MLVCLLLCLSYNYTPWQTDIFTNSLITKYRCCFTPTVHNYGHVNLTTIFLGRLQSPKRLTIIKFTYFSPVTDSCSSWISGRGNESACTCTVVSITETTVHAEIKNIYSNFTCLFDKDKEIIFHIICGVSTLLTTGSIVNQYDRYSLEKLLGHPVMSSHHCSD